MFNIKYYSFVFIFLSIFKINAESVQLDKSFGLKNDGIVNTDVGTDGSLNCCVVDSYKRILCAGSAINNSKRSFVLARYFRNGLIDVTFGNQGVIYAQIGDSAWASSVVAYKNKIFVAGTAIANGVECLVIICYDSNGKLYTKFGTNGVVIQLFNERTLVNSLNVDNEGNLLVAGQTKISSKDLGFVARYKNNGTLDTNFAEGGVALFNIGFVSNITSISFSQNYNKIILSGWASGYVGRSFLLVQLNSDGTLDPFFGMEGKVVISFPNSIINVLKATVTDCGNNIYLGGYFTDANNLKRFALVSLTPQGLLNTEFGDNGYRYGTVQFGESEIESMVLSPENKVIAALSINKNITLTSFDKKGNVDLTFGADGFVVTPLVSCNKVNSILLQSLTRLLVVGTAENKFNLIRYKICINKNIPIKEANLN